MAMNDVVSGAGTGATIGGAVGSVVPGVGTAVGTAAGGLLGGALGGLLSSDPKETAMQTKQRELIDQLLASLSGEGPYSSLFSANPEAFQKSFVEPAKRMFANQIAPQIQQSYIAGGQQRSTGLQDTLTRAGVNLDDLLNQQYMNYLQSAQNRQSDVIGKILGAGAGVASPYSSSEKMLAGLGGYLTDDSFKKDIGGVIRSFTEKNPESKPQEIPRKGFEMPNYRDYGGLVG